MIQWIGPLFNQVGLRVSPDWTFSKTQRSSSNETPCSSSIGVQYGTLVTQCGPVYLENPARRAHDHTADCNKRTCCTDRWLRSLSKGKATTTRVQVDALQRLPVCETLQIDHTKRPMTRTHDSHPRYVRIVDRESPTDFTRNSQGFPRCGGESCPLCRRHGSCIAFRLA